MAPTIEQGTHVIAKKWGYGNYGTFGVHLMKTQVSASVLRGEIIVFEYPVDRSLHYVKRVVGLPGDRITYYNKRLKINDQEVPTSPAGEYLVKGCGIAALRYVERIGEIEYHVILDPAADLYPPFTQAFPFWERCSNSLEGIACTGPELHFFVLGDYRDNSSDSRVWGFVPVANLVGKIQHIVQQWG